MSRRQSTPTAPRDAVLEPATVRPDYFGRTHPDPREDPPTVVLDPSGAPTEEIPVVGPETEHIPAVGPAAPADPVGELDTVGIPVVAAGPGGPGPDGPARPLSALLVTAGALAGWLVAAHLLPVTVLGDGQLVVSVLLFVAGLAPLAVLPLRRRAPGSSCGWRRCWSCRPPR
ncbi:hypothetical protein BJF90_44960 [Pseudonocardia sp. CNS-004]|nr:hypothetical protein BJF90_44960 [Pseudonocardia sp. CNS-004]